MTDEGRFRCEQGLDASLTEAMHRTGAAMGGVYLLVPGQAVLRQAVLRGMPEEFLSMWAHVPLSSALPVADALRDNRLVWVSGQEDMARRYPRVTLVLPYPFSAAAAPLTYGEDRLGALFLIWAPEHGHHLARRERARIASVCRRMANVIKDAGQPGHPDLVPGRPRVLPGPAPMKPASAADFVENLPGGCCMLDLEGRMTFVDAAGAALLGRDRADLVGVRPWHALPWLDDPVYEDRYRAAVMSREPVSMTAFRPPDHWLRFDLYPGGAGISVRIHREEGSGPAKTPPPSRKTDAGTPPGAGQAYRLVHFAAVLTEAVSVDDVVARVADEVLPAFHAQGLAVVAFESGRLRVLGHRGYPPGAVESFDGTPLDAIPPAAARIFTSAIPTFFATAQDMLRVYPDLPAYARSPQARAVLPLIVSGRPIGACMLAYDRPHTFQVAERSVLTALAGVLAQALDRARLFDAKHQIAHGLQQALLPRALPDVPGLRVHARYLPATERMDIGGDFYDLIDLGPAGAVALIGDVQGHNIAAAALMGQVRTAIHAHAAAGSPPDDVLTRTNRLLTDLGTNLFTTCLHVHLDPATGRARLANAGHPPPILCPPGRTARVLDVTPGPPLGIDPDATYPVTDTTLPPHAILLLYTDGLVETPDTDLDHAISALARSLPHTGRPALEHLADTALTHPATGRRTDDTALLLLQLLPPTE